MSSFKKNTNLDETHVYIPIFELQKYIKKTLSSGAFQCFVNFWSYFEYFDERAKKNTFFFNLTSYFCIFLQIWQWKSIGHNEKIDFNIEFRFFLGKKGASLTLWRVFWKRLFFLRVFWKRVSSFTNDWEFFERGCWKWGFFERIDGFFERKVSFCAKIRPKNFFQYSVGFMGSRSFPLALDKKWTWQHH